MGGEIADTGMAKTPTGTQTEIIRAAIGLVTRAGVDHLLYVGDLLLPEEMFRGKPKAKKRRHRHRRRHRR